MTSQVSEITLPNQQVSEITPPNQQVSEITPPNQQVSVITPLQGPQTPVAEPSQNAVLGLPIVHLSLIIQDPLGLNCLREAYIQWQRPFVTPVRPLQAESGCSHRIGKPLPRTHG